MCNYRECFQVKSLVCKWEAINSFFFFQPSFFLLFNSHLGSVVIWFVEFSDKKCAKQIGKKMLKKVYYFGANKFDNCVMFSRKDLDLHNSQGSNFNSEGQAQKPLIFFRNFCRNPTI